MYAQNVPHAKGKQIQRLLCYAIIAVEDKGLLCMQEQMKDSQTDISGCVCQPYLWEKCVVSCDQPTPCCPQASLGPEYDIITIPRFMQRSAINAASSLDWGVVCLACMCVRERGSVCVSVSVCDHPAVKNAAMTNVTVVSFFICCRKKLAASTERRMHPLG